MEPNCHFFLYKSFSNFFLFGLRSRWGESKVLPMTTITVLPATVPSIIAMLDGRLFTVRPVGAMVEFTIREED